MGKGDGFYLTLKKGEGIKIKSKRREFTASREKKKRGGEREKRHVYLLTLATGRRGNDVTTAQPFLWAGSQPPNTKGKKVRSWKGKKIHIGCYSS